MLGKWQANEASMKKSMKLEKQLTVEQLLTLYSVEVENSISNSMANVQVTYQLNHLIGTMLHNHGTSLDEKWNNNYHFPYLGRKSRFHIFTERIRKSFCCELH